MKIKRYVCVAAESTTCNEIICRKNFATREEAAAFVKQEFLELLKEENIPESDVVWKGTENADYEGPRGTFWYCNGEYSYTDAKDNMGCEQILEIEFEIYVAEK